MDFRILGAFEVLDDDGRPVTPRGGKLRVLLATLLVHANDVASYHQLIDSVWGEQPPSAARSTMQCHVSRLRRLLRDPEGRRLCTRPGGYLLRVEPGELDLDRFRDRLGEARAARARGMLDRAGGAYRAALKEWRGGALGGLGSEALDRTHGPHLNEQYLVAAQECFQVELDRGRAGEVVAELDAVAAVHPGREPLQALLMRALYRSGRRTDALAAYQRVRRWLVDEVGVEPGLEMRSAHEEILRGEEAPAAGQPAAPGSAPAVPAEPDLGAAPAAAEVPRPAQLPPDLSDFTGRELIVERLSERLVSVQAEGRRIMPAVSLVGQPGVGKTALAIRLGHLVRPHFPDGQLFVNLQGAQRRPLDPGSVLAQFLRALGVEAAAIPDDLDERSRLFRARLAEAHMLVVLDNAADETQVRPLLPGGDRCAVLITSRHPLAGLEVARPVRLSVLGEDQALALLSRITGPDRVAAQAADARQITRLCGFLPLALRIAGARLAVKPHWPLARLVALLADERSRLDELTAGDVEVRASLTLSYQGLAPDEQRALRLASIPQAQDLAAWPVAALLGVETRTAEELLERLVDCQLVEPVTTVPAGRLRYRFHDLTRVFARERLEADEDAAQRSAAVHRLVLAGMSLTEWAAGEFRKTDRRHRRIAGDDDADCQERRRLCGSLAEDPFAWFDAERATLVGLVEQAAAAGLSAATWRLTDALSAFFEVRGQWDQWRRTHETALAAAHRAGDRHGEAVVRAGLGRLAVDRGRFDDALAQLVPAEELSRDAGDDRLRAETLRSLGDASAYARPGDAARCYRSALEIYRGCGDRIGEVSSLRALGLSCRDQGRFKEAADCLTAALAAVRAATDRTLEPWVLSTLGLVHLDRDEFTAAATCFRESVDIAVLIGDPRAHVYALRGLGDTLRGLGRADEAEPYLREALTLARAAGDDLGQFHAMRRLGDVYRDLGRLGEALTCVREALVVVAGARTHPRVEAEALYSLGCVHRAAGRLPEAADALRRSLTVFTDTGLRLPRARAAHELSVVLAACGDHAEAAMLHKQAAGEMRALRLPACDRCHASAAAEVRSATVL